MTLEHSWEQFPRPLRADEPEAARPVAVELLACWLVAGLGPCLWVRTSTRPERFWWVVAITVVGTIAMVWTWRRSTGPAPPLAAVAGVAGVALAGGPGTAVWAFTGGLVATWALSGHAPAWTRPPPPRHALASVGLAVAAVVIPMRLIDDHVAIAFGVPASLIGVAGLVAAVPAVLAVITQTVTALTRFASAVFVGAGLTAVAAVVVVVPWIVQRTVRWDPTWAPRRRARWVPRRPGPADPRRMWSPDPRTGGTPLRRRLHAAGAVLGVLALAGATAGGLAWKAQLDADRAQARSPALRGSRWWPEMSRALNVAYGSADVTSFVGIVMPDIRSDGLHITDGRRRTWRAPVPPECRPQTLWMFGGSTLFGEGQRDDHTIPSRIARRAWSDGLALRVENRGVPGDAHWMEVRRFELALASGEDPPDVAVFYDGTNDLRGQIDLDAEGLGGQRLFANDLDARALRDVQRRNSRATAWLRVVRGGPEVPTTAATYIGEDAAARFAARGYAAAGRTGASLAEAAGVERAWFYQPSRASRRPAVPGDGPTGDLERAAEATFRSLLPRDAVDISDAVDGVDKPLYWDSVHMNEAGAAIVGDAIYERLRPGLERRASETGEGRCG